MQAAWAKWISNPVQVLVFFQRLCFKVTVQTDILLGQLSSQISTSQGTKQNNIHLWIISIFSVSEKQEIFTLV